MPAPLTPDLQAQFDALNRQHFDGRLPHYSVSWIEVPPRFGRGDDHLGITVHERRAIEIRSDLVNPDVLRKVLLHEMCHVDCRDDPRMHGSCFITCLERLAIAEPVLADEIEVYKDHPVPGYPAGITRETGLWLAIESLVLESRYKEWPEMLLALAEKLDNTTTEAFEAEFPQARAEWAKAVDRARRHREAWGDPPGGR